MPMPFSRHEFSSLFYRSQAPEPFLFVFVLNKEYTMFITGKIPCGFRFSYAELKGTVVEEPFS
jgi:hypothetical protein